jgi:hypothetical protein
VNPARSAFLRDFHGLFAIVNEHRRADLLPVTAFEASPAESGPVPRSARDGSSSAIRFGAGTRSARADMAMMTDVRKSSG